jgi:hypothetical protein
MPPPVCVLHLSVARYECNDEPGEEPDVEEQGEFDLQIRNRPVAPDNPYWTPMAYTAELPAPSRITAIQSPSYHLMYPTKAMTTTTTQTTTTHWHSGHTSASHTTTTTTTTTTCSCCATNSTRHPRRLQPSLQMCWWRRWRWWRQWRTPPPPAPQALEVQTKSQLCRLKHLTLKVL